MIARHFRLALTAIAATVFATQAAATPLSSQQILHEFNAVVLADMQSQSHVDGRTWVGGKVTGGDYAQHANDMPASTYAGLTVMGNAGEVKVNAGGAVIGGNLSGASINAGSAVIYGDVSNSNLNGAAWVGGSLKGSNTNGGRLPSRDGAMQAKADAAHSTDFAAQLGALSTSLAQMSGTGSSVTFNGYGKATFNAVANANGVAVFNLFDAGVFKASEFEFHLGNATTVILNASDVNATIGANFLGGSAQTLGSKLIWNFQNATSITTNAQFGGTILAPSARLTNKQNIEGGVFVRSLDQHGELHLQAFDGNVDPGPSRVPEPGTWALLAAGALMLALTRKRTSSPGV
ncbi:choice-of-anchor A family protein [Massilia sp. CCM 8734]|uniref:choice-of-anchor A family protein n=1 Tax=Massilia sp. CCM 8734 TaxID=2609283 RepID=UPI0014230C14|nr:choice-of-anchor A family protein [Massilia sp. CCM 8734]NHZ96796.1 choice-of-anchor A family protein [Massilia sp. CCM 8734]